MYRCVWLSGLVSDCVCVQVGGWMSARWVCTDGHGCMNRWLSVGWVCIACVDECQVGVYRWV